jgi:hypothetical protein
MSPDPLYGFCDLGPGQEWYSELAEEFSPAAPPAASPVLARILTPPPLAGQPAGEHLVTAAAA